MAFIVLRRSRNTRNFYLVESYRDRKGKTKKRTLCYLGREQDGTDTIAKAIRHWEKIRDEPYQYRSRRQTAEAKIRLLRQYLERAAEKGSKKRIQAWERQYAPQWEAIRRLRRYPSEENARAAKLAFRELALVYHPDRGGDHHAFIQLKNAYDAGMERLEPVRHGR